jgi:hypothetical protein
MTVDCGRKALLVHSLSTQKFEFQLGPIGLEPKMVVLESDFQSFLFASTVTFRQPLNSRTSPITIQINFFSGFCLLALLPTSQEISGEKWIILS